MSRFSNEMKQKDGNLMYPSPLSPFSTFSTPYDGGTDPTDSTPSSSSSSSFSSISPILLLVIVILAVIFFVSGLLHLLVRFLLKRSSPSIYQGQSNRYPERPGGSHALQRQLQHLFRLHDSGLDQTFIDALPVFLYKDIMGLKEPFDCAVCLYEFSDHDSLRLLPVCSHAFHINCIDTWLLSNSTCPLCRATLLGSSFPIEIPRVHVHEISRPENGSLGQAENVLSGNQKRATMEESGGERKIFSVRLGKFKRLSSEEGREEEREEGEGEGEEKGESSRQNNLDARRCYSMGTYQYVVMDSDLQVASSNDAKKTNPENFPGNVEMEGKKISGRSKGESFSVSKIWLWPKKSGFPIPSSSSNTPWKQRELV